MVNKNIPKITRDFMSYIDGQKEKYVVNLNNGASFEVFPGVFPPESPYSKSSEIAYRNAPIEKGSSFLDIGTGSGILAIDAAIEGAGRVEALDIDLRAVECARGNARRNSVARRVAVFQSDLFENIVFGRKYDVIAANLPILDGDDLEFPALFDKNFYLHKKLFLNAPKYLENGGVVRMAHMNLEKGGFGKLEKCARANGFRWRVIDSMPFDKYEARLYEFSPKNS